MPSAESSSLPSPPLKPPPSPGDKSGSGSGLNSQNGSFGKDDSPPLATHQIVGSYTAEETAFHRAFPAVPLSEKLVDHYQCSVMRNKVVRLGKLYLTSTRLCFTSTFIRDPINLPWEAVASVQRRTNFLFDSIVLKRTKEAIDAQHHSRHHHQHSRSMSQGFDATATSVDSLTSPKEGGAPGIPPTYQPNSSAVDHAINEQIYGSGGVGDEESLTGFISGSSDQAFRMIQMLWSVRSRFQQQERDSAALRININMVGEEDSPKSRGIAIESPHLGSGSEAGNLSTTSPLVVGATTTAQSDGGNGGALSPLAPSTHQLASKTLKLEPVLADATDVASTTTTASPTSTTTTDALATKKRSKSMGKYISSGLRSSMSAVSTIMPGGSTSVDKKKTVVTPAVAASPDDEKPPYVLHPSDDDHDDIGGTPEEDLDGTSVQSDDGQDDDPVSPSQIPQPMSALQQAAGVAAGDVNAHKYTALLLKSFPLVPKNEVVIESFQCSYVSGVHRLGRLYVTSNYLLFSSPFMSEGLVIRMVDVASISRWQTMKVLDGLSIDIRPDTKTLTAAHILQAGGILPAVAINNSRVLNPQQLPPSASSAALAAADIPLHDEDLRSSTASPHGSPTTPRINNKSRSTSVINRQETMEAAGASDDESNTPPRSPSPSGRPQSVSMTTPPLGSSFAAVTTATDAFYTKTSYAFTSFVGSRDAAIKLIRHLHAPHYIRAEEAADTAKEAVSTAATTQLLQQQQQAATDQAVTAAASAAVDGNPTTSSSSPAATAPPPAALRPANEAAFYLTAPKLEDSYAALNTVYGTDISPITNFFNGDNSRKLLAEQPVYFPEGVGLMDIFRDVWSDDTRAIDAYHSDRKDTEMKWTKWDRITACDGHTSVTKQLEDVPADSLDADSAAGKEFLPPAKAGQRVLKCKTLVKAVGCTVCDFTEFQKYAFMKVPASDLYGAGSTLGGFPPPASAQKDGNRRLLVVQISGQAVGAMFSDTFRAEALLIFEEEVIGGAPSAYHPLSTKIVPGDAGASTAAPQRVRVSMVCYGHIQFVKSVWGIKGKIVSVALTVEMPECYRTFYHEQMKPRALKLIKSRQQHSSLTSTAASLAGAAVAGIVEAVTSAAVTALEDGGNSDNSAVCGGGSHSSGSHPTPQQSGVLIAQGGGGGVSLRGSLSPANLFPSAGFNDNNTPSQMAILVFVAVLSFFVVWWSAWGLLSCMWGSVSVPATIQSSLIAADGIVSPSPAYDVATAEVHAAIFNTYIRPLIGSVYGVSLAVSVSVLMEYIQQLTK